LIGVKIKSHADPDQLVQTLQSLPGTSSVIMVAGNFDLFVLYVCRNLEEFRRFIVEHLRCIPEIASFESYIGLDLFARKFLVGVVVS
jgi:DNA-binding Lrp family transcriptional regulator